MSCELGSDRSDTSLKEKGIIQFAAGSWLDATCSSICRRQISNAAMRNTQCRGAKITRQHAEPAVYNLWGGAVEPVVQGKN